MTMLTWVIIGVLSFIVLVYMEAEQRLRILRLERAVNSLRKSLKDLEDEKETSEPSYGKSRTMWGDS